MKRISILFLVLSCLSCTKDNPATPQPENANFPDFTALAIKNQQVFQLDIFNNAQSIVTSNLTTDIGVPEDFARLDVSGDLLTFYAVSFSNFSVYQKNIVSGAEFSSDIICQLDLGETRFFPLNSQQKVLIFSVNPNGCSPLMNNLRILDKASGACTKLMLTDSFDCNSNYAGIVIGETAYLSQIIANGEARVVRLNLMSLEEEAEVLINGEFKATVDGDTFYVFTENTLVTYDSQDFTFLNSKSLNTSLGGQLDGWFKTSFSGDEMLFDIQYPQPSAIERGPAVFDIETGEIVKGDDSYFFNLREQLNTELATEVFFTAYAVNLADETILCAYKTSQGIDMGGVVLSNFKGEILANTLLDYEIQKLIIR